jgi:hypothetical protein
MTMTELNTFNSLETTVFLVFAGFLIGLCVGSMIRDYKHAEEEKIYYGESRIFPFDKGVKFNGRVALVITYCLASSFFLTLAYHVWRTWPLR